MAKTPAQRKREKIARLAASFGPDEQGDDEQQEKWFNGEIEEEPEMLW